MRGGLTAAYRRTGADLPGSDPRPTHGAQMEGWFWRFTDVANDAVVIALCGINRHPDGDWATVAVAAHPEGVVVSDAVDNAMAFPDRYLLLAGDTLSADARRLHVELPDVTLDLEFSDLFGWPLRFGAGGVFSALPWLGQYWHPHVLGGRASGSLRINGVTRRFDGAQVYAEKNWGAGFPDWWWWGQAQGFSDPTVCVAFGGGRLRAGPLARDITGCVVRLGDRIVRFAPPLARVCTELGDDTWEVTARTPRWRVLIEGDGRASESMVLPVPLPDERRNVNTDFEHLAARMRLVVEHKGRKVFDDVSTLAGLEVGSLYQRATAAVAGPAEVVASTFGAV